MKILRGPNDKWYSQNMTDIVVKCEESSKFVEDLLNEIQSLLQTKWDKKDAYFYQNDYIITGNAAYAGYVRWGNDIDEIKKQFKINSRDLYQALEPGMKDRHYDLWNKAVQKVLWQILFLRDFQIVLKEIMWKTNG